MAEEFRVSLGLEIKSGEIDNIRSQINNIQTSPITLTMNTTNVQNQINSIRRQIQNLSNIRINLSGENGNTGVQRTVADVTRAYNDLMNLQRRINSIRIQIGGLDTNKNSSQISVLSGQLNRLMTDYNNLYQTFSRDFSTNQLDNLSRAFEVTSGKVSALNAKMADTSSAKQAEEAYRELYNIAKKIDGLELKIRGLDSDKNRQEVEELLSQLNNLRQIYQQLSTDFQGQLSPSQLSNLGATLYDTQDKLRQLDAKVADTKKRLAEGIRVKFDNGTFANDMNKVEVSLSKIQTKNTEVVSGVRELNAAFLAIETARGADDIDELIRCYDRYENALKNVKNQIEINQRAEQQNVNASKLAYAKQALSSQMDVWLKNNSAAAKQFGGQIEALKAKLNSCDAVQLDGIKSEFKEITRQAELAGKATQTFGDRLKSQMSKLGTYFSASMIITEGIQAMRAMYENVVEVDTAMTGLYRVTDLTATQYDMLYDDMIASAKEYGSTLTDIINSTADWVRLGFDANEANQLSEISAMYQHISDLDYGTAVENLVTAYKGFQGQLLNLYNGDDVAAIRYVADIFNELGNKYAVSAEDVGAALTRSASALDLAGNTIQESAAMVTGIAEVTQDPEKAGSALKVLSLRLRGMKGELEELGEDVDENVESLSKMQTQVLNLTKGKVNIFNDDGSFKSTYEMMDAIADIYYDLSATDQADLLETIAGKNRANDIAALISNWRQVEAAMKSALGAEGSATKENAKYMDSIQGRLDALTASWQALSNTIVDSDFIKVLVTGLTDALDIADAIVNTFGSFGTIGAGIAVFQLFKHMGGIKSMISLLNEAGWSMSNFGSVAKMAGADLKVFAATPAGVATSIGLIVAAINIAIQAYRNYRKELRESAQASMDNSNKQIDAVDAYEAAYVAASKYADKTNLTKQENNELQTAIGNVSTALGTQAGSFDTANGSASEYLETLKGVNQETLESNLAAAKQAVKDSRTLLSDTADPHLLGISVSGSKIKTDLNEQMTGVDTHVRALEIVNELMSDYIDIGTRCQELEPINYDNLEYGSEEYSDAIVDYYYQLLNLRDALSMDDLAIESDIYESVNKSINLIGDSVEQYVKQKKEQLLAEYEYVHGIPTTVDEYFAMREAILENIDASEKYKEVVGGLLDIEWGKIFDLSKATNQVDNTIDELEKKKKELIDTFKDNSISEWFNSLSEDEKNLLYTIDVKANDTTLWTLTRWKQELADLSATGKSSTESIEEFYNVLNNAEDGNFSDTINEKIETITRLQEALVNINELTDEDILDLAMDFPSLVGKTGDVQTLSQAIAELIQQTQIGLDGDFTAQLEALGGSSTSAGQALLALQSMVNSITSMGWSFDIDKEIEKFNNLYDAKKESVSGTGLSTEAINSIENMFSSLDGYDPSVLFERTEHGIHLNTAALRTLQSQYESMNKLDIQKRLQDLKQKYNDTKHELDGLTSGTDEYNKKAAELKAIENQIYDVQTLAAQYEGLTSAYNKWILAQSAGEEGDMYDNITGSLKEIKQLYDDGLVGTNAFRTAVQMMTNEDLSTANIEKLLSVYQEGYPVMQRYFTDSQDGCIKFLEDIQALNSEWAHMNEDGTWEINFGIGNDEEIAAAISQMTGLEMSTEQVQIILRKLSDYGFDINLDSAYTSVEELQSKIENTEAKLKELGQEPIDIDVNAKDAEAELEKAVQKFREIENNSAISPEVKTAQLDDAGAKIDVLVSKINQPKFMSISVSEVDSSIQSTLTLLQDYQTAVNNVNALELKGADASEIEAAKNKVNELATQISALPSDIKTKIGLETDGDIESIKSQIADDKVTISVAADTTTATTDIANIEGTDVTVAVTTSGNEAIDVLKTAIDGIADKSATITVTTVGKTDVDALKQSTDALVDKSVTAAAAVTGKTDVDNLKSSIDALYDKSIIVKAIVAGTSAVNNLKSAIDKLYSKTVYATTITKTKAGVDGTANAQGTAYARGNWGTKESGVALGGELGQELVVRNGKWFTIGDQSAEFFKYKKGDIIFNAAQTAEIFAKGKITHSNGRGRALAEGTAFSGGSGKFTAGGSTVKKSSDAAKRNAAKKNASDNSKNKTKDFEETFDWIEVAIDRIERAISRLDLKANSVYKSWSSRNKALKNEMSKIRDEIALQEDGYNRYIKHADSVGLSNYWAKLVQDGAVDIDTIKNESLAEQIKEYQEWYEKALDCKDAIDELNESLAESYKLAFDNVVAQYDGILAVINHEKSMLDEYIAQSEAKGYVTSSKYYEALIENERNNIDKLANKKSELIAKLGDGVASGTIKKGSEAWYEMANQIDEVTLAIEQGNTAIIEYANSIRDIEWELFDMLQSQISQITNEANFLINLFSNDKLFNNKGQLTDEGMATMGLHGQNYNVYMAQADKYAQEILNIDKGLENEPYNQDLLNRRQELLELQRESILAAEDEKQAIVDMVSEGVELELDALQELIDTYTDALDAQKDLYDYQKKVAEQTKKVADLEKQMAAYNGDTSEEARAKVQQIKVSLEEAKTNLEETEYQRYISDQKKLLDDLYSEYENILNSRFDNIGLLISNLTTEINKNAGTINTTLSGKAESVGTTLSNDMTSIWGDNSDTKTITNDASDTDTTVNKTLNGIETNLQNMVNKVTETATVKTESANKSSVTNTTTSSNSSNNKSTAATSKSSSDKSSSSSSSKSSSRSTKDYYGVALAIWNGDYGWGSGNTRTKRLKAKGFDATKVQSIVNQMGKDGYIHSGAWKGKYYGIKSLSPYHYNKFVLGKHKINHNQLAWTQEKGQEMIVRPSDGAILTPLAKQDSVLNAGASNNIWDMANNPADFIRDNLKFNVVDAPVGQAAATTFNQHLDKIVFNLPNVKNYEELLSAMQSDKNFERLILSMTIDRVAGKSSLAKGKSIR